MRYVRIFVLMALSAIMVATATSCKKDGKLVGTWEHKEEHSFTTLTFNKGGSGVLTSSYKYPRGRDSEGKPMWEERKSNGVFTWTLNKTTLIITVSEEEGERKSESSSIGFFDGKMLIVNGDKFSKK